MRENRGDVTVKQAGRLGGLATLRKQGRQFYAEIGRLGQRAMRAKHPNMASEWGKLGGRPRKPTLDEINRGKANNNNRRNGPA